jgi:ABC-type multidrug transport system ATPase subunit
VRTGLALRGVTKRYAWRGPWILTGTDLTLASATRTSVVGSNGSGKSTLLRIAAGVTSPTGGTASIPLRVGYVPERQAGRGKFTGNEYLTHMGRIRGLGPEAVRRRGSELLQRLNLRPGPDVPWEGLSKGNRQKVIIAQAFLADCDAMILDEPSSGLDHEARGALEELIGEAVANGASVLTSGPETDPTDRSDRVYRLTSGSLVEVHSWTRQPPQRGHGIKRVELTHTDGAGPFEAMCQVESVLTWHTDASMEQLVLEVEEVGLGSVLRAALDQGWSVESVASQKRADDW